MDILFAHSFFMAFDDKQREVQAPYPPLGALIAAAMARREGHCPDLFDSMLAESPASFQTALARRPGQAVVFFEDNFNWLSKMCLQRMREACQTMIRHARAQGSPIVVAGSDASDFPRVFLDAGADYVIKGEAEFRLLELLRHWELAKTEPFEGPGVFRLDQGQLRGAPPARGERNLSAFPEAAWDLVDIDAYRRIWRERHGYFSLNMVTTRGCPYRCNWCAKPIHGRRYDVRQPVDAAREMARLKRDCQPDHIWFADDIFGLKPGWVEAFAEEIARLDAAIPFKIQARADLMKPATVAALKRAGCRTVWMGVESGSQAVLDAMDKDLTIADVHRAARLLHEADIEPCFFLQFGYPGEQAEDIRATWELVRDAKPTRIGVSVSYPLPDTPFYDRVRDQLGPKDHWSHSQDMRPIFKATYPGEFYPQLYQYIHCLFGDLKRPPDWGLRGWKRRWRRFRVERRLRRFGVEGVPFS